MAPTSKAHTVDEIFERAAKQLGDITDLVISRTYRTCPDAKASFEYQSVWNIKALEARMVEETVLCVLNWYENPAKARLVLQDTIPHHVDTFDISLDQFYSIFDALFDVIEETIPKEKPAQFEVWQTLRKEVQTYTHSDAVY